MTSYLETIFDVEIFRFYCFFFSISFLVCLFLTYLKPLGYNRRAVLDSQAVQSAHTGYVPRIGGLGIYVCILFLVPISVFFEGNVKFFNWLIVSSLPVFIIGVSEDLGVAMSPVRRLVASLISGALVVLLYGIWLRQLSVPGVDFLMGYFPVGIAFTLFATSGVVNAFNLIDGLNGLSSYVTISTGIALSIIAFEVNFISLTVFMVLIVSIVLGFAVINFPLGKIFLGDAGAYALGHILVWSSIILVNFDYTISPFSMLLIFFWPVGDTCLAIWRRLKLGNPTERPDRLHFHHVAMRLLEIRFLGRAKRHLANPIATILLIPFISIPQFLGVFYYSNINATILSTVVIAILFLISYVFSFKLAKKSK